MKTGKNDFTQVLCSIYMIFILAVLPLYTGGTYWKLGDTKYLLFRNVSFLCLGIYAVGMLLALPGVLFGRLHMKNASLYENRFKWSIVDSFMIFYGACVLLSALLSAYPQIAWNGYTDWYMGVISQLLFIGIYFMVSRCADSSTYAVYLGEAAILAVSVIALLQRLWIDPLRLMKGSFWVGDWECSHMLSTVGNINWICGYYSVALAFPVVGFLYSKTKIKKIILYGISVLGLVVLCMQGSDSGFLVAAACIVMSLLLGLQRTEVFQRGLLLAAGTAFLLPVYGLLTVLRKTTKMLPSDGNTFARITWGGWWILVIGAIILALLVSKLPTKIAQRAVQVIMVLGALTISAGVLLYIGNFSFEDGWGSGRGKLWQLALQGFEQGDLRQKLFGSGPDCFAAYIEKISPGATILFGSGRWAGATFANAHNEWLNTLVNLGTCGILAYFGIFAAGVVRYRKMPLALFVLAMYGANSLLSFQQVMNAPLLFLVLGLCESRLRRAQNTELFDKALTDGLQSL